MSEGHAAHQPVFDHVDRAEIAQTLYDQARQVIQRLLIFERRSEDRACFRKEGEAPLRRFRVLLGPLAGGNVLHYSDAIGWFAHRVSYEGNVQLDPDC